MTDLLATVVRPLGSDIHVRLHPPKKRSKNYRHVPKNRKDAGRRR